MQTDLTILRRWLTEGTLRDRDFDRLAASLDRDRLRAWDIPAGGVLERLRSRAELLQTVFPQLEAVVKASGVARDDRWLPLAWDFWLPLAQKLATRARQLPHSLVWGILGLQGTGKTTLARILQTILTARGYSVLCLSIDDLYKTYRDRLALQKQDPQLIWRGPPGTHDVALGLDLLDRLRARQVPLQVPRFDKALWDGAGDRIAPQPVTAPVDILLFEGWFLGVRPIPERALSTAPWPIVTVADRAFASRCNQRLAAYLPLWDCLDGLLALYPDDYRHSQHWRQAAERQARLAGKGGMSDREVAAFVEYFWRALHPELFVKPLLTDAACVDLAIALNAQRQLLRIYTPG